MKHKKLKNHFNRSKILGMLVGGAIGDAIGRPVESMSFEKACENYPNGVSDYLPPHNNKWFKDDLTGVITDDTQLTIATMKALILAKKINMDVQAHYHILAMQETTEGWGGSTRDAIERLSLGVSWKISGKTDKENRGLGNGVAMKISPLAAWFSCQPNKKWFRFAEQVVALSAMTHYTRVSARAAVTHAMVLNYLLSSNLDDFSRSHLFDVIILGVDGQCFKRNIRCRSHYYVGHLLDPLGSELKFLDNLAHLVGIESRWSIHDIIKRYENGNCNVSNSLPFSYAFFLRNPSLIETLYNVASSGGDADTNSKFVGEMLGALHGLEWFHKPEHIHLVKGLKCYDDLITLGNTFCDTFGVN